MKNIIRVIIYFLGLFSIAIGINLALTSNLGISPVSAFTLPISQITEVSLGTITIITYVCFVVIQIIVLGKRFKPKNLLQAPFSVAFGFFVDYTGQLLQFVQLDQYFWKLIFVFLSIIACALGATLYIAMDIVPNAPEGLILAISEKTEIPFSKLKVITDCAYVVIGAILSLIFLGRISSIREGTILSALLVGKIIGVFTKKSSQLLRKIAFENSKSEQKMRN